ncbi:hypothetical protein ABZX95_36690 [Streptomyces sp. NPDC004232]|uniref:hypothetical protein n=1 Tax=Streptomyces sp. NPDC004232 TaxID=3154454 RepID=UPI0033BE9812
MSAVALPLVPARLGRFVLRRFRPQVYAAYGVLWALALEGSAVALAGTAWRPTGATAVRAVSVVLTLLFLRMLDEQKDLAHDRVHHPDRPLVTGAISAAELRGAMAAVAVVVVALNALLSPVAALLVLLPLGYALLLPVVERLSAPVREGQLLNLAVTYPVQVLVGAYVYLSLAVSGPVTADWRALPLLGLCAGVFLHFEFARKTAWESVPDDRLYSSALGPVGGAAAALAPVAVALLCDVVLFRPAGVLGLLPCLAALLPVAAAHRFLTARRGTWPLPPAMGYIVVTYLALVLQAVVRP